MDRENLFLYAWLLTFRTASVTYHIKCQISDQCLVTENEDRKQEDSHVEEALWACGYPKWTFNKVRCQTESERDKKTRQQRDSSSGQWSLFLM